MTEGASTPPGEVTINARAPHPVVPRPRNLAFGLALLAGLAGPGASAAPQVQKPAPDEDPARLIAYRPQAADRLTPLPGTARPYAEAKRLLARGEPTAALKALEGARPPLLADREALLRGDALLALGKKEAAKAAYLEAIQLAQVESVALLAARGLVDVLGQLRDHEGQLAYVDALLTVKNVARRPNLVYSRAEILRSLGRYEEAAQAAWRILLDTPTAPVARNAERLLRGLKARGIKVPATSARLELARIRTLTRARAFVGAEQAIAELEKANPELKRALTMKRAELAQAQRDKAGEAAILQGLLREGLTEDDGAAILLRLGQLAMSADDDAGALGYFDLLREKFPKTRERREGQYLAGWIPYNAGDFPQATTRMLAYAEELPRSKRRTEALWWAGWASYLGGDFDRARGAFEQLIQQHPTSELVTHARYWLGRMRQKAGEAEAARTAYREVLKEAPLTYYGFWAAARLEELGETIVLEPPPPEAPPASLREVLARLGAGRPANLDRAVTLHSADLQAETLEELGEAERALTRVKDTQGRTLIADMLTQLGAHHLAFRAAMRITQDGGELASGEPWAWRAWRHAYPKAFEPAVKAAATAHEIDGQLVLSIMRTESHFRPHVRSHAGARGLMQLMPNTAKMIGRQADGGRAHAARYNNPDSNVWLGGWYLKQLLGRYHDQIPLAAGAYNAGPRSMDRWLESYAGMPMDEFVERVPYRETRRYMRRVVETLMVYRRLYGGELPTLLTVARNEPPPEASVSF